MNNNKKLTNLKLELYYLLEQIDEKEGLNDADSELLFQLSNDPSIEEEIEERF